MDELQRLAASQNNPHAMNQTDWCLDYLRHEIYNGAMWAVLAGQLDTAFTKKATDEFGKSIDFPAPLDPDSKETIDLPHLAATCDAVIMAKGKYLSDIAGWGGNLLTALKDAKRLVAARSVRNYI